jgi:hypothetical protein
VYYTTIDRESEFSQVHWRLNCTHHGLIDGMGQRFPLHHELNIKTALVLVLKTFANFQQENLFHSLALIRCAEFFAA